LALALTVKLAGCAVGVLPGGGAIPAPPEGPDAWDAAGKPSAAAPAHASVVRRVTAPMGLRVTAWDRW
jgi:hypothetical protein